MSTTKSSNSKLEKTLRKFDQELKILEAGKRQHWVSSQTLATVDIPYSLDDPLPPIFGYNLCHVTKPVFLSKSVPDLSKVFWVLKTEDDILKEIAEEALNEQYDQEIVTFYDEAKKLAKVTLDFSKATRGFADDVPRNGALCKLDIGWC